MISPHTPAGTRVICVDASEMFPGDRNCLSVGGVYTVDRIVPWRFARGGFNAMLVETAGGPDRYGYPGGFALYRFRRAELPSCLTEILTRIPIREDAGA